MVWTRRDCIVARFLFSYHVIFIHRVLFFFFFPIIIYTFDVGLLGWNLAKFVKIIVFLSHPLLGSLVLNLLNVVISVSTNREFTWLSSHNNSILKFFDFSSLKYPVPFLCESVMDLFSSKITYTTPYTKSSMKWVYRLNR